MKDCSDEVCRAIRKKRAAVNPRSSKGASSRAAVTDAEVSEIARTVWTHLGVTVFLRHHFVVNVAPQSPHDGTYAAPTDLAYRGLAAVQSDHREVVGGVQI